MKLYLSSYRLGDDTKSFTNLFDKINVKVAVINNAKDANIDLDATLLRLEGELADMKSLGFIPEHIDLRNYFNNADGLYKKMSEFDAVWVSGGNSFILRKAMQQSGFEVVVDRLIKTNKLVYSGYSAALCVISPTLDGADLVDDKDAEADGYDEEVIWDGYGLIDFHPIVHYKSDHPESADAEKELAYVISKSRKYETLRDGETIVVNS